MRSIIPKPKKEKTLGGKVAFSSKTLIEGDFPEAEKTAKNLLVARTGDKNTLKFIREGGFRAEQYSIDCKGGNITVKAGDEAGAFYALMTLEQLSKGGNSFEAVSIEDEPKYGYRGFMLDCARHFWSVEKIKSILDIMSRFKMNIFHWHLSEDQGWRPEIKKYPLLTQKGCVRGSTPLSLPGYSVDPLKTKVERDRTEYGKGCFYSQKEMKDVVAYAKERHIDIIPEIDMPGHLVAAIACYPELSCSGEETEVCEQWGVMDNIACCGSEKIYEFAKDVIDELVEIFPYKYFHIGGDEVPKTKWKTCPKCQAKIKELGLRDENALQAHFNNVISEHLKGKGKITMGWNEILESSDNLDIDIVAQWWTPTPAKAEVIERMAKGGKIVLSKWGYVYMDHAYAIRPLKKTYSLSAKEFGIKDETNVLGVEAPQWTEYIRTEEKLDFNTFPRLAAIAEVGWTAEGNKNYADFEGRLEDMRGYFGKLGIKLAPQQYYRGKTVSRFFSRYVNGWKAWRADPNFELKKSKGEK